MNDARVLVAAFYRFVVFEDFAAWQPRLKSICESGGVTGSILLAPEGINGTIAGRPDVVREVVTFMRSDHRFAQMEAKESWCDEAPFVRLKVRLKREIIPLGTPVDVAAPGIRVRPEEWNGLLDTPGIVVLDTRNDYEVQVGTFPGAVNPGIDTFREFAAWVDRNPDLERDTPIAMFCTGGIRCEKASAYLLERGFAEVYQLDGGILNYLASVSRESNRWEGECYVFDRRVTVDTSLHATDREVCVSCNRVLGAEDRGLAGYQEGVTCNACYRTTSRDRKDRFLERHRQVQLARDRNPLDVKPG